MDVRIPAWIFQRVPSDKSATALKTDPMCVSLANQISTLKGDGTIDRLEKAAAGKSAKVQVKREALQKQAELNKANADFQVRCGPTIPKQVATQANPGSICASRECSGCQQA